MFLSKTIEEFKNFAFKGNVLDLAVWVVIGTAFGKIVASLVADIITPLIGIIAWWVDFKNLAYVVKNPVLGTEAKLTYGMFLQSVFDFVIVAFALFIFIKLINNAVAKMKKKQAAEAAAAKKDEVMLLEEIRDLLKKQATKAAKS
jgi:large conductance mechanosensitive channel